MATKDHGFRFVSVRSEDAAKDRETKRQARSHAIKQALEKKRKVQQQSGHNFRVAIFKENPSGPPNRQSQAQFYKSSPSSLSAGLLDPFQMLVADSSLLKAWLSHRKPTQINKPVFSIVDELILPNFLPLFRTGLGDPALLNATMLTLAFAITGTINQELLKYHNQALSSIREKLCSPEQAASESTLAAILLMAGMEARLSMPLQVQLHMNAVQQLLKICQSQGVYLADGIKRAIFWQDLNSSIMTGCSRIVDHTTFAELQWTRDPFTPDDFTLQPGFQQRSHLLTKDFIEILKDIHAMQCIRETGNFGFEDVLSVIRVDNHQASIQSRLAGFTNSSSFLECCRLTAYLCSTMLRCRLWRNSVIPSQLSLQLLDKLKQMDGDPVWDEHLDLLVWSLHIGGAFAPVGVIRSDYIALLRLKKSSQFEGMYGSWPELLEILKRFIWSDKAFSSLVKAFWVEVYTPNIN